MQKTINEPSCECCVHAEQVQGGRQEGPRQQCVLPAARDHGDAVRQDGVRPPEPGQQLLLSATRTSHLGWAGSQYSPPGAVPRPTAHASTQRRLIMRVDPA